jgi:site-specific DNA-cytosine methylase
MVIKIGTDCSGIEAPIEALKQLNIPFEHKWACEKDKFARQSLLANYSPEILYDGQLYECKCFESHF